MSALLALAGFIGLAWLPSVSGIIFRPGRWYRERLERPSWNPPDWLFGPAWSVIFTLLGVASWLVWREGGWSGTAGLALVVFLLHLPVNGVWSYLFFGRRRPDWAGMEVMVLWAAVLALVLLYAEVRLLAGLLLVPYLAWVTFATILNLEIWRRNRDRIPSLAAEGDEP